MRKLLFILLLSATSSFAQVTWLPDSSFADDGVFNFNKSKEGHAIIVQPDNKIIVGGNADSCYLVRLHPDGTIDSSFGNNGYAFWTRYGLDEFVLTEMALQEDGKIVIVGYSEYYDEFIARFTANGEVDSSFNGGYQLISSTDYDSYYGFDVEELPSGKILTVGLYYTGGFFGTYTYIYFVQLNPDGSFDNSFSGDGKYPLGGLPSEHNLARAMVIQPDGKIVIGGYYMDATYPDEEEAYLEVVRLNSNFSLDTTFHSSGYYRTKINGNNCRIMDVLYTDAGKIICAGYGKGDNNKDISFLLQLNSDGSLDNSFGTEGKWISADTSNVYFRKLAIRDGNIYVTGEIGTIFNNADLLIMGFDVNGIPLADFGINGLMVASNSNKDDVGFDIAIQNDNKIVIGAGLSLGNNAASMSVLRILPEGIDTSSLVQVGNTTIQIFPNPIQASSLTLELNLAISGDITIDLIDITGKTCAVLLNDSYFEEGIYSINLPLPLTLASGQYILRLTTNEYYYTQMLIVL